jgi:hypothetical protein
VFVRIAEKLEAVEQRQNKLKEEHDEVLEARAAARAAARSCNSTAAWRDVFAGLGRHSDDMG